MIQAYHDAGIGVIMDVVYNHTFSTVDAPFQTTVPDYYYRMNPDGTFQNGTGVGNETARHHAAGQPTVAGQRVRTTTLMLLVLLWNISLPQRIVLTL